MPSNEINFFSLGLNNYTPIKTDSSETVHLENNNDGSEVILQNSEDNIFTSQLTGYYPNEQTAYIANIDAESKKIINACTYDEEGNPTYLFELNEDGNYSTDEMDYSEQQPDDLLNKVVSDYQIAQQFAQLKDEQEETYEGYYGYSV